MGETCSSPLGTLRVSERTLWTQSIRARPVLWQGFQQRATGAQALNHDQSCSKDARIGCWNLDGPSFTTPPPRPKSKLFTQHVIPEVLCFRSYCFLEGARCYQRRVKILPKRLMERKVPTPSGAQFEII